VPLYATVRLALSELSVDIEQRYRRRAGALIPAGRAGIGRCRELSAQWLSEWSRMDFIHVASLVAAGLVEAALSATDTEFVLRLETDGSTVQLRCNTWASRIRCNGIGSRQGCRVDLVAANSRTWGTYPTLSGNTIGPSSAPRIVSEPIRCQRS
jgi:hypothetical protein